MISGRNLQVSKIKLLRAVCIIMLCSFAVCIQAQEVLVPLWGGVGNESFERNGQRQGQKQLYSHNIPFFDDFSQATLDNRRWCNPQSLVTNGWGLYPPTLGVALLDAVDENGNLYRHSSLPFSADTLLSAIVRLDSVFYPFAESISPADSLYFSFFYLPGGKLGESGGRIGDVPEPQDSLVLDFYVKSSDCWVTVWSSPGISPDNLYRQTGVYWQRAMIPVTDTVYMTDSFRFRFRNICSLDPSTTPGIIANSDQWYLDCVFLDRYRSFDDVCERDVAFVHQARSLLKNYCAMPARHYRRSEMTENTSALITNRFSQTVASHYEYYVISENGDTVHYYDGGFQNVPSFPATGEYQSDIYHAAPPVAFAFPADGAKTSYRVVHVVKEGVLGDDFPRNDTTVFLQVFDDYFAYDDGTAENGYGLTSTSSNVFLACAFQLNEPDTLLSVRMFFNHVRDDENENMPFRIAVWRAGSNGPGERIYRDETARHPAFAGLNSFVEYELEYPVPLNGLVYIGIEQEGGDYINIGFDRNYNHSDRLYYRIGSEWQRASVAGSIMLRPCFVPFSGSMGIGNADAGKIVNIANIFPNPTSIGRFTVENIVPGSLLTLCDSRGVVLATYRVCQPVCTLPCSDLPRGVYFLSIVAPSNDTRLVRKLIVR